MEETQVINLWTNPRSLSTCLTYAFAQRSDTQVLDDPLHAFWLHTKLSSDGKERREATQQNFEPARLTIEETDGNKIVDMILDTSGCGKKYRFCKHMVFQFVKGCLNPDLLAKSKHILLIRNPIHCLSSLAKILPIEVVADDWSSLTTMYTELLRMGKSPPIVDARDLQENPEGILRALCHSLNMEFQPEMLKWEAGPKDFDVYQRRKGATGPFSQDVHRSSGFFPAPSHWSGKPFPVELYPDVRASWPAYLMLKKQAIKPLFQNPIEKKLIPTRQTLVWVDNGLVPMEFVHVPSQETESIHEILRISERKIFNLKEKISGLRESAKARSFPDVPSFETMKNATFSTALANGMFHKARLCISLSKTGKCCNCHCMLSVIGETIDGEDENEEADVSDATLIP